MHYLYLAIAICSEVAATSLLKASEEFSRFWPSLGVIVGYAVAFYCLSLTLRVMPIGVVYALWSGIGIVLVAIAGFAIYGQRLDLPAMIGIALIIAGVLVINLLSHSTAP